ncbi:MAG: transglycosylase SLT domain-containing protein [Gemmatimonadota bacterium]
MSDRDDDQTGGAARRPGLRARARRAAPLLPVLAAIAAVNAGAWALVVGPRISSLRDSLREHAERLREAEGDRSVAEHELGRLQSVVAYSEAYDIPADLAAAIHRLARAENLDPDMAFRLVQLESGFRQRAVSPVGAIGYTQLLPSTAAGLEPGITEDRLFDRDTNLRLGFQYLRQMIERYDDQHLALLAYNRGPGVVQAMLARGEDPRNGFAGRILGTAE